MIYALTILASIGWLLAFYLWRIVEEGADANERALKYDR